LSFIWYEESVDDTSYELLENSRIVAEVANALVDTDLHELNRLCSYWK
jgi:hypothetical protein